MVSEVYLFMVSEVHLFNVGRDAHSFSRVESVENVLICHEAHNLSR